MVSHALAVWDHKAASPATEEPGSAAMSITYGEGADQLCLKPLISPSSMRTSLSAFLWPSPKRLRSPALSCWAGKHSGMFQADL